MNSLRGPPAIPPHLYAAGASGGGADLEAWRPEVWDRDYNRRYRFNNTRVQRKEIQLISDDGQLILNTDRLLIASHAIMMNYSYSVVYSTNSLIN